MISYSNTIINLYLVATLGLSGYVVYDCIHHTDNYFSAGLQILDNPMYKMLLYNLIIAIATIVYRTTVWAFFQEIK